MGKLNEKAYGPKFDTTTSEKSLATNVEPLIGRMGSMAVNEIAAEFMRVLEDPAVHVSDKTKNKCKDVIQRCGGNKTGLMMAISNMYLAGARLAVESESFESKDKLFEKSE